MNKLFKIKMGMTLSSYITPILVINLTFLCLIYLGETITVANTFVVISMFTIIE